MIFTDAWYSVDSRLQTAVDRVSASRGHDTRRFGEMADRSSHQVRATDNRSITRSPCEPAAARKPCKLLSYMPCMRYYAKAFSTTVLNHFIIESKSASHSICDVQRTYNSDDAHYSLLSGRTVICHRCLHVALMSMLQHAVIEAAISRHYACKEVRSLGHGSVGSLLKYFEKHYQNRSRREPAVFYETALVARQL